MMFNIVSFGILTLCTICAVLLIILEMSSMKDGREIRRTAKEFFQSGNSNGQ